jgi:hypothetical protein
MESLASVRDKYRREAITFAPDAKVYIYIYQGVDFAGN